MLTWPRPTTETEWGTLVTQLATDGAETNVLTSPLSGYEPIEVTVQPTSPAVGSVLGNVSWPEGWVVVAVASGRRVVTAPDDVVVLAGEPVLLLAPGPVEGTMSTRRSGAAAFSSAKDHGLVTALAIRGRVASTTSGSPGGHRAQRDLRVNRNAASCDVSPRIRYRGHQREGEKGAHDSRARATQSTQFEGSRGPRDIHYRAVSFLSPFSSIAGLPPALGLRSGAWRKGTPTGVLVSVARVRPVTTF